MTRNVSWGFVELRTRAFDHPDAQRLIAEVQQVYVQRYGGEDRTPTEAREFAAPEGTFVVGYLDGVAVACGGWRVRAAGPDFVAGDAELKRMYVVSALRGRGLSRVLLAELERRAVVAGLRRLVLETGLRQPEAIGLYVSSGYAEIPRFGMNRGASGCRCFAKVLPVAAWAGAAGGRPESSR